MKLNKKILLPMIIIFILSACGGTEPESTLSEEDVLMTYSVGTMIAGFFGSQTAMVTPSAPSTNTPLPTNTIGLSFLPAP